MIYPWLFVCMIGYTSSSDFCPVTYNQLSKIIPSLVTIGQIVDIQPTNIKYHYINPAEGCIQIVDTENNDFDKLCSLPNNCGHIETRITDGVKLCVGVGTDRFNGWYKSYNIDYSRLTNPYVFRTNDACTTYWFQQYTILESENVPNTFHLVHKDLLIYMGRLTDNNTVLYPDIARKLLRWCLPRLSKDNSFILKARSVSGLLKQIPIVFGAYDCEEHGFMSEPRTTVDRLLLTSYGTTSSKYCDMNVVDNKTIPQTTTVCDPITEKHIASLTWFIDAIEWFIKQIARIVIYITDTALTYIIDKLTQFNTNYFLFEYTILVSFVFIYSHELLWTVFVVGLLFYLFGFTRDT